MGVDWNQLAKDRDQCWASVNTVAKPWVLYIARISKLVICQLLKRNFVASSYLNFKERDGLWKFRTENHCRVLRLWRSGRSAFITEVFVAFLSSSSKCWGSTVELNLSWLFWTASHPAMWKIRIIGFFFGNRLHWQYEIKKNCKNGYFRLHICLRTSKTWILNSLYVLDNGGKF